MGLIYVPSRSIRADFAPDFDVDIDWSNPLTYGLRALVLGSSDFDYVSRTTLTSTGITNRVATTKGYSQQPTVGSTATARYIELPFELSGAVSIHATVKRNASVNDADSSKIASIASNRTAGQTTFWEFNLGNGFGLSADDDKPRFSTNATGIGVIYADGIPLSGNNPATTALANNTFYQMTAVAASGASSSGSGKTRLLGHNNLYSINGNATVLALWDRELSANEVATLAANPHQLLKRAVTRIWVPVSSGAVTGTGALTAGATIASGSGAVSHTGTGALTTGATTASGVGVLSHTGTGALTVGSTTASGSGTVTSPGVITGTGALTTSSVTASGSGIIAHTGNGAILISDIVVSGAGVLSHNGTGAITTNATNLSGTGGVVGTVTGTGSLVTNEVTLSGTGTGGEIHVEEQAFAGSWWGKQWLRMARRKDKREEQAKEAYQEIRLEAPPEVKQKAKEIIEPFRQENVIEWDAIADNVETVRKLIKLAKESAIESDDEEVLML